LPRLVLLAHRGRGRQDIATDLGAHRKTVTRWLNAYCADGLDGLQRGLVANDLWQDYQGTRLAVLLAKGGRTGHPRSRKRTNRR
jgi:transposase